MWWCGGVAVWWCGGVVVWRTVQRVTGWNFKPADFNAKEQQMRVTRQCKWAMFLVLAFALLILTGTTPARAQGME